MAAYENDAFFCLFRYDIKMKIAKCLLFVKLGDYSERRLMRISDVREWLESHKQTLDRHPLMVLNAILGVMQSRAHEYIEWRIKLNNMESQLGVTKYAEALREGRYEEISHDFELLNADIAGLSKRAANNALSASTILEHAKALQRLVAICDEYEVGVGENQLHTRGENHIRTVRRNPIHHYPCGTLSPIHQNDTGRSSEPNCDSLQPHQQTRFTVHEDHCGGDVVLFACNLCLDGIRLGCVQLSRL